MVDRMIELPQGTHQLRSRNLDDITSGYLAPRTLHL